MGLAKQNWIETMERGWDKPDTQVCDECFEDEFLSEVVQKNIVSTYCSYCKRSGKNLIAANLSDVLPYIAETFFYYYVEPENAGIPYDLIDQNLTYTEDALLSIGLDVEAELFDDICDLFVNDAWVPGVGGSWLGEDEHEILNYSWNNFTEKVKHTSRYFIFHKKNKSLIPEYVYSPKDILQRIGEIINQLSLWKKLPLKTIFFRARKIDDGFEHTGFSEIGPPHRSIATAGRMNPAGISYGYFSADEITTILEVADKLPSTYAIGKFELLKPITIIDLTDLPSLPSIFDANSRSERNSLLFLKSFVDAISVPVSKDGKEHIDYVPSQIISEFFAQILRIGKKRKVDGMIYPSAVDQGYTNLVLFPRRNIYGEDDWEAMMKLTNTSEVELHNWKKVEDFISRKHKIDWYEA